MRKIEKVGSDNDDKYISKSFGFYLINCCNFFIIVIVIIIIIISVVIEKNLVIIITDPLRRSH